MYTNTSRSTQPFNLDQRAFSMVEVLVVSAILLVLIATALPLYQRIKHRANGVKCSTNLRSWGIAYQLYATENGGFYPFGWLNNSDHWMSWMAPYVDESWLTYEPSIFAKRLDLAKCGCPGYLRFTHPTDPNFRPLPYSYNSARFDYPFGSRAFAANFPGGLKRIKGTPAKPSGWYGWEGYPPPAGSWDVEGVAHRYNGYDNLDPIANVPPTKLYQKQGQCVVLFCGVASCWRYMSTPYAWWFSGGGGGDWDVRTGDYLRTDANGIQAYDYNGAPTGIHGGSDNYLFMDGHVETLGLSNPNISRYVFNEIPNLDNPYK